MYNIKVEDFINVKSNKSPFDLNDLIHICKRKNNSKREYLFVNRYQGKHIPEDPYKILTLLDYFVAEVKKYLNPFEKILVVGFAETATGIAEYLTYQLSLDEGIGKNIVYHLQTSREVYTDCPKLFTFDEEHSHAVNQFLYSKRILPHYDRVLFVEDEITTGNTILNFINEFKKINPNCKYSVASILNWQNDKNKKIFEENNIDRIFLVEGEIKSSLPSLNDIVENSVVDYYNKIYEDSVKPSLYIKDSIQNSRHGVDADSFKMNCDRIVDESVVSLCSVLEHGDSVMVIGTEEFMFYPLMIARDLQMSLGVEVKYRATTRSPICSCFDDNYIIKDSINLPSAYDENRETYLYNMNGDYNKIVVISDVNMTNRFKQSLNDFANKNHKDIIFIEI